MRAAPAPGSLLFGHEDAAFRRARAAALSMASMLVEPIL